MDIPIFLFDHTKMDTPTPPDVTRTSDFNRAAEAAAPHAWFGATFLIRSLAPKQRG
jgi:hypothetical protein